MPLSLEDWYAGVSKHLQSIEAGAEICERHAKELVGMPEWDTLAMDRLLAADFALNKLIVRISRIMAMLEDKQHVS